MGKMYKVKITVIKKVVNKELADKYLKPSIAEHYDTCPLFEVGQTFIADGFLTCPQGFCYEAWQNIWPYALAIARGGTFHPYTKEENQWISCCTDGLKPVTFLLERGEEMELDF